MYEKKRIYILVKTYPTISKKYAELVCTAGVLEDGSWIRLFPMPFRLLKDDQKYPKYSWIQVEVERNTSDFRPESYRPDLDTIVVEPKPKKIDWNARRKIVFNNKKVHTNLKTLIKEAKSDAKTSLALFKPTEILNFTIEQDARNWDDRIIASLVDKSKQMKLFTTIEELEEEFRLVQKIPYKFSYRFKDDSGTVSKLKISDWEVGMLYLNCLKTNNGNEQIAKEKVKQKYMDMADKCDIHFYLGTIKGLHLISPNPFIIVGVYAQPKREIDKQMSIFANMVDNE